MARILVIDDEELVRMTVSQMLESDGHRVTEATDGKEGLAILRETPMDLVITDILLPKKDGVEIIREIKQDFPDVKIIAITGFRGKYNRLPAAAYLGAQRTLTKPFKMEEMLEAVEEVLGEG